GKLDAPGIAAKIDRIEIELENFILAQRLFHARRNDHLADLALVGEIFPDQEVFHDLLGDGRAPLGPARLSEIADKRTDQTALVHTLVLVESFVFRGDESVAHVVRDIGEHHPYPSLVLLEYLREALSLAIQHHTRAGKLEPFEFGVI